MGTISNQDKLPTRIPHIPAPRTTAQTRQPARSFYFSRHESSTTRSVRGQPAAGSVRGRGHPVFGRDYRFVLSPCAKTPCQFRMPECTLYASEQLRRECDPGAALSMAHRTETEGALPPMDTAVL